MPDHKYPTVERKDAPPPGVIPRNAQTLVLGGVAVIMVLVIAFSGRKSSTEQKTPAPTVAQSETETNQRQIQEYKARIEEQAARLRAEQAQLAEDSSGDLERFGPGSFRLVGPRRFITRVRSRVHAPLFQALRSACLLAKIRLSTVPTGICERFAIFLTEWPQTK